MTLASALARLQAVFLLGCYDPLEHGYDPLEHEGELVYRLDRIESKVDDIATCPPAEPCTCNTAVWAEREWTESECMNWCVARRAGSNCLLKCWEER